MRDILFDGKHKVSKEEVIQKMNYFIETAEKGMQIHEKSSKDSLEVAKGLRNELEKEYKNNSLVRIENAYKNNRLFHLYRPAVHEAVASITGRTTYKNAFHFLYDVYDYMRYYLPNEEE